MSVVRQYRIKRDSLLSIAQTICDSQYSLVVIVLIYIILGFTVSLKVPLYQGADEGWHYAYVEHYALGRPIPDFTKHFTSGDPASPYWQTHEASQPPLYYILMGRIAALVPRGDLIQEQVLAQKNANGMYGNFLPSDDGSIGTGFAMAGHLVRFATVFFGAILVFCSYLIAKMITSKPEVALLTAALVGFNPHNLMLSGAISNDIPVACMAALTLLAATSLLTQEKSPRPFQALLLGTLAGLTILTKYSGGAVVIAALAAILCRFWKSRYTARWVFSQLIAFGTGALLVSGVFFAHNLVAYGDPLAWNEVNKLMPPMEQPRTALAMISAIPFILGNFFAHPGYILPTADTYNHVALCVFIVGIACFTGLLARKSLSAAIMPLIIAVTVNTITFILWLRTHADTENMRFFTPSIIPITLMISMGISMLVPQKVNKIFVLTVIVVYGMFTSITLNQALDVMYAFPHYLSASEEQTVAERPTSGQIAFSNGIKMLDVNLSERRISSGSSMQVSIVWLSTIPLTRTAHLMLDLRNSDGTTLSYLNTANEVRYAYLSRAWQIGQPLRETYNIPVTSDSTEILTLLAGWSYDGGGSISVDNSPSVSVEIGRIKVSGHMGTPSTPAQKTTPVASFTHLVDLIGTESHGNAISLTWYSTSLPDHNYKIFVHGTDELGQIVAQNDVDFEYSAAYWDPGETFSQEIVVPHLSEAASVLIGIYDPSNNQRIAVTQPDGSQWRDNSVQLR